MKKEEYFYACEDSVGAFHLVVCDDCDQTQMRQVSKVSGSSPKKYKYECPECKNTEIFCFD